MEFDKIKDTLELSQDQYALIAKPARFNIFKPGYPDPFGTPFKHIEGNQRIILFNTGYGFFSSTPDLQQPLLDYMKKNNEPGFFYSFIDENENLEKDYDPKYHLFVPNSKIDIYEREMGPLENIVYSVNGNWAFTFSYEDHCLFSGPRALSNALMERIPDLQDHHVPG